MFTGLYCGPIKLPPCRIDTSTTISHNIHIAKINTTPYKQNLAPVFRIKFSLLFRFINNSAFAKSKFPPWKNLAYNY